MRKAESNSQKKRIRSTMKAVSAALLIASFIAPTTFAQAPKKEAGAASGPLLTLEAYLEQVRLGNKAYRGSVAAEEGAVLREDEGELLTTPNFFSTAQSLWDRRETASPLTQGTGTDAQSLSFGVSKQNEYGTEGRLYYNFNHTDIAGASSQFLTNPDFYTSGPVVELSQDIGRNGFGRETRALKELQESQAKALRFSENFRQTTLLSQGENAYWRLVLAREAVEATKETLARAKKILDWSTDRRKLNLGDRADELQAQAAVLARRLELQSAQDEAKNASRFFNTVRGVDADVVVENLLPISHDLIAKLEPPKRAELRDDVKAAEQQKIAAQAASAVAIEKNKPSIEVFGNVGLNGRDPVAGDAISESVSGSFPNAAVGLRMTVPLDFSLVGKNREGHRKEAAGAQLVFERRVFEQEREWNDLVARFKEAAERLTLAREIEEAQKTKLDYERTRHRRGRTTTYQVILFEQDFANAQLSRIRAQADVLNLYAQLKTFREGQ